MIPVFDPARPTVEVGRVEESSEEAVDFAVRAATAAFPGWRDRGLAARGERLLAAAEALASRAEPIGDLLCAELGKPLADARGEVAFSVAVLRDAVARAAGVLAPTVIDDVMGRVRTTHEPYGVCAGIVPWNAPVILAVLKLAPALIAGNAMVLKPSPLAPLALDEVVRALAPHLPDGLLGIVHGDGTTGQALVTHDFVRKVAFTGGEAIGVRVGELAARGIKPLVLELGGNDPAIFCADADLERPGAIEGAVFASFLSSGQVCMAAKRLYVHESIVDRFVDSYLAAAARCLVVGDPTAPETTIGPMISFEAVARQDALRAESVAASGGAARVHLLGRWDVAAQGIATGHFSRPALVTGLGDDARLVCDEQFGPTVPLLTFRDDDDVIERANASSLGLGASVWSSDEDRAFALADRLEAGMVFINCHNRAGMTMRAPFGGWKHSGHGREYGDDAILGYTQTRTTHAPASARGVGTLEGNRYPT